MADKEATVFVIDLGASMGTRSHGRDKTNLDWSMDYVWDKIMTKVAIILRALSDLRSMVGGRLMLLVSLVFALAVLSF
jgi:hypothetical protein